MKQHEQQVAALAAQMNGRVTTAGRQGNVTWDRTYKQGCTQLDLRSLNRIISVSDVAICEPGVTMEQLATVCLPQVVPEFRKITVGGAISGAALESSSHRFGQFSDTCLWIEVLTGDGRILRCSPEEHSDLFYALPGSYGTLGLVTAAAVRLLPQRRSVALTYEESDRQGAVAAEGGDFLEALALGPDRYVVIRGSFDDRPARWAKPWDPWFYQELRPRRMRCSDYLFRYDQGAFWMGRYALHPKLLWAYLRKKGLSTDKVCQLVRQARDPKLWQRLLLYPWLSTQALYRGLQAMPEAMRRQAFLIQDSYLPQERAAEFLAHAEEAYGIFPMWLCPVRGSSVPQLFSPHSERGAMINVGTYGVPARADALGDLERTVAGLGGRKGLYSHSTYSEAAFWQIYNHRDYQTLRRKYGAEGVFPNIEEKVLDT